MSKYVDVEKIHSKLVYAHCHPCDYRLEEHCRHGACKGTCGIVQYTEKNFDIEIIRCHECRYSDDGDYEGRKWCKILERSFRDDFFCALGEPKEVKE